MPSVPAWMTDWMKEHLLRQGTQNREQAGLEHGAVELNIGHGEFEVPVEHLVDHSGAI